MKVESVCPNLMQDDEGNYYLVTNIDPSIVMSQTTGELFKITKRDAAHQPIEVQNLYEYEQSH